MDDSLSLRHAPCPMFGQSRNQSLTVWSRLNLWIEMREQQGLGCYCWLYNIQVHDPWQRFPTHWQVISYIQYRLLLWFILEHARVAYTTFIRLTPNRHTELQTILFRSTLSQFDNDYLDKILYSSFITNLLFIVLNGYLQLYYLKRVCINYLNYPGKDFWMSFFIVFT